MLDFIALFGGVGEPGLAESILRSRPGLRAASLQWFRYPWGKVLVQHPGSEAYDTCTNGRFIGTAGRASLRRQVVGSEDSVHDWLREILLHSSLQENAEQVNASLSGMYAVVDFDRNGFSVLSDHMGFLPVYQARSESGKLLGIGTNVEALSTACDMNDRIDEVSVAEMFVYNQITFPFTTREGIQELPPCALTRVRPDDLTVSSQVLWEPNEPDVFPGEALIADRLLAALKEAGEDITHGVERVGVLLSGGIDSRAVLSAIPQTIQPTALTYVTRENNESRVAGEVARAAGVQQVLVQRSDTYYPELVGRGLSLLGMELRGNCHGICITDNHIEQEYELIVGGQLSDTLLKDHFMPFEMRAAFRPLTLKQRVGRIVRGRAPVHTASVAHTTGRAGLEEHLTKPMREAVRERREHRIREVQRVRPQTYMEWQRFWPCSRQDDSAHTLGNLRLFSADTLFAHQSIVEVSRDFSPRLRVDGSVADRVFLRLMGKLGEIRNANTGLPASSSRNEVRKVLRKRRQGRQAQTQQSDWNAVESSWVDPVAMQKNSAYWIDARKRLQGAPSTSLLDKVIARGGSEMIREYQDDLPSNTNHIAMQLALWLETIEKHQLRQAAGASR